MARVELSARALENLARLIETHSLPANTRRRLRKSLRPLQGFPRIGTPLEGRWKDLRFILGPWRWLIIVYAYFEDDDRVVVVTIQDGRTSGSPTVRRSK